MSEHRWLYKTYEDRVLTKSADEEQAARAAGYADTYTLDPVTEDAPDVPAEPRKKGGRPKKSDA